MRTREQILELLESIVEYKDQTASDKMEDIAELIREEGSISWGELAELTHATQVERFGWCICEDPEQGQMAEDCPTREENK